MFFFVKLTLNPYGVKQGVVISLKPVVMGKEEIFVVQVDTSWRVGQGFDVHAFADDRPLILGGVRVSDTHGLTGHSDADVLAHAICDALLGAANLGDLCKHYAHRPGAADGALFPADDSAACPGNEY
mgnify:CR=1 FL=1